MDAPPERGSASKRTSATSANMATSATSATSANMATSATSANMATSATSATSATTANVPTSATQVAPIPPTGGMTDAQKRASELEGAPSSKNLRVQYSNMDDYVEQIPVLRQEEMMSVPTDVITEENEDGQPTKRGRIGMLASLLYATPFAGRDMSEFLEFEVPWTILGVKNDKLQESDNLMANLEQVADKLAVTEEDIRTTRREEISKLDLFKVYAPCLMSSAPPDAKIYAHTWVDSYRGGQLKSRVTLRDLKVKAMREERKIKEEGAYDNTEIETVQSPTPSNLCNRLLMFVATHESLSVVSLDVMSAFLHAPESQANIYMKAPSEWDAPWDPGPGDCWLWHMQANLYGRRCGPNNFRKLFEAVLLQMSDFKFKRGRIEPCLYWSEITSLRLAHHVDDVRVVGPSDGHVYLGRVWVRVRKGWIVVPEKRHARKVLDACNYSTERVSKIALKVAPTPGVAREEGTEWLSEEKSASYRSCVGSLIFLAADVEELAYSVKELARDLMHPQETDWLNLTRMARYLSGRLDYAVHLEDGDPGGKVVLSVYVDANWGSHRPDGRSTTGFRVTVNDFVLSHGSFTQPGLPAMLSAEAELRALSRAVSEAIWCKQVCLEAGIVVHKTLLLTDAKAAWQSATKLGVGRLKHLKIADNFVREAVAAKEVLVAKIDGTDNPSDIHTKYVDGKTLEKHAKFTGYQPMTTKYSLKEVRKVNDMEDLATNSVQIMRNYENGNAYQLSVQAEALELKSAANE
eukprot:6490436-Amphidinium_carterae.1